MCGQKSAWCTEILWLPHSRWDRIVGHGLPGGKEVRGKGRRAWTDACTRRLRAHADGSPPAACSRCGVRGGMVDCGAQAVVEGSTITVHLCDTHCLAGDGGFALHWAVSMRTRGLTTSCSYVYTCA